MPSQHSPRPLDSGHDSIRPLLYLNPSLLWSWVQSSLAYDVKDTKFDYARIPENFRLINVDDMCLVEFDKSRPVSWCALSYLWETDIVTESKVHQLTSTEFAMFHEPGSFINKETPGMLRDCIKLVKAMCPPKQRFLWIDRFCIIQDSDVDKDQQLKAMDVIYRQAQFTLICALDDRSNKALPGFYGTRPKPAQCPYWNFKSRIENRMAYRDFRQKIDSTLWDTKGWTFQERILSERRLYITKDEAMFESRYCFARESLLWHYTQPTDKECTALSLQAQLSRTLSRPTNACHIDPEETQFISGHGEAYKELVSSFSRRNLTFISDSYAAFRGVESYFRAVTDKYLVFGVDLGNAQTSLLWSVSAIIHPDNRPNPEVPSWSWTRRPGSQVSLHMDDSLCLRASIYYWDGYHFRSVSNHCNVRILNPIPEALSAHCRPKRHTLFASGCYYLSGALKYSHRLCSFELSPNSPDTASDQDSTSNNRSLKIGVVAYFDCIPSQEGQTIPVDIINISDPMDMWIVVSKTGLAYGSIGSSESKCLIRERIGVLRVLEPELLRAEALQTVDIGLL